MKNLREEFESFKNEIKQKSPKNIDFQSLIGKPQDLFADSSESLPSRDYEQARKDYTIQSENEIDWIIELSIPNPALREHRLIKPKRDIDISNLTKLRFMIEETQIKSEELMNQMDMFPDVTNNHQILAKVQERLTAAIVAYENYKKKCEAEYSILSQKVFEIEPIALEANNEESVDVLNHRNINDIINKLRSQNNKQ